MKRIITSAWFWLMNIFFILLVITLTSYPLCRILHWLINELFWVAIGSAATFVSAILAVCTYRHSENIRKKKATYDAYDRFKNDAFESECKIASYKLDKVLEERKRADKEKEEEEAKTENFEYVNSSNELKESAWIIIKDYLARVERIAVCVNNGILDIETVYNMGGPFMIEMYEKLEDIIRYKRKKDQREGIYEEFEEMVKSLRVINRKRLRRGK